jgi:hypothetical protein
MMFVSEIKKLVLLDINLLTSAHLRRERSELRAQLNQKISILVEVRAALQEASLREAALKSEVRVANNVFFSKLDDDFVFSDIKFKKIIAQITTVALME